MWESKGSCSKGNDDPEFFAGQRELEERQAMIRVIDGMTPEEIDRLTSLRFGI